MTPHYVIDQSMISISDMKKINYEVKPSKILAILLKTPMAMYNFYKIR